MTTGPSNPAATQPAGEFRAGGTDVEARRRRGRVVEPIVDLRDALPAGPIRTEEDGTIVLPAMTRLAAVESVAGSHPGVAAAAGSLANPHTRAVATVGGALAQRTRCPYFRTPGFECHKTGHVGCPARHGDHRFGVLWATSACLAPHPSTMAMVLLCHDATIVTNRGMHDVAGFLGDGTDPSRDHMLALDEVITEVRVPPPFSGERAAYSRVAGRALAEWPMVEAVVRLDVAEGSIASARVGVGAVAPIPLRLAAVEDALVGRSVTDDLARVAGIAVPSVDAPDQTRYKLDLLRTLVGDVASAAAAGGGSSERSMHEAPLR